MKKIIILLTIFAIYITLFAGIFEPFGRFENFGLVNQNKFRFFDIGFYGDLTLQQSLFSTEHLLNLINEGKVDLNQLQQLVIGETLNGSLFSTIRIGKFSISPFVNLNSFGGLELPDEILSFIKNDIEINKTYSSSSTSFISLDSFLNAGVSFNFNGFFVSPEAFVPITYVFPENQVVNFEYTSSSTPPVMSLKADLSFLMYSPLLVENLVIDEKLIGIGVSLGYSSKNFGIAVNNITIKPSEVDTLQNIYASYSATYNGVEMTFDDEATANYIQVFETKQIEQIPEITAYVKANLFVDIGAAVSYKIDGKWVIGGSISKKLFFIEPSYQLIYDGSNSIFTHIIGLKSDFRILYLNTSIIISSNEFIPLDEAKPGIGLVVNFGLGF
ncbi:hypothetical protein [Thermosipho atlanticus]|uniref:Uncharacterized protein n=1 Tax=Thermosipho atlanticus DSM 15807 TaxID=1123380 RepID=A0A1M5T4G7_9BACT|nr:hypothetical protein [Thermosipho atlanticus]SHH45647.1 hypothetical protein SAMN02745199_1164 [Thermosipho atlanticus DSM 15807]